MPWKLALCALLLGACFFDASYGPGVRCNDGKCPSGLICVTQGEDRRCLTEVPIDAPPDSPRIDASPDGPPANALTCVDPGPIAAGGGTFSGATLNRSNFVTATCGGFVMNGRDAVYRVTNTTVGDHILVSITGVKAYVLAPCAATPAIPTCLGNSFASPGNPISVTTTFVGPHFIVVDHETAGLGAAYSLMVTVN